MRLCIKIINGLSFLIKKYPKLIICMAGIVIFLFTYLVSENTKDNVQALFVNLAAGSIIITITVLIVDATNEMNRRLNVRDSAISGVSKIQMANFDIITQLGDKHFKDLDKLQNQLIKDLVENKNKKRKTYIDEYITKLLALESDKLLADFTEEDFVKLRKSIVSSIRTMENIIETYSFSFSSALRNDLLSIIEIGKLIEYAFSDVQILQKNGKKTASQLLSIYLKRYQIFQNSKKY